MFRFSKLTKNLQFGARTITGISCNISRRISSFKRVSDENRACSISIRFFFKFTDPCVGRSFPMCSHDPIFGTNNNRILNNGSCERALRQLNFQCESGIRYDFILLSAENDLSLIAFVGGITRINFKSFVTLE